MRARLKGSTLESIAQALCIPPATVDKLTRTGALRRKLTKILPEDVAPMTELYRSGEKSIQALAAMYRYSTELISACIQDQGITVKDGTRSMYTSEQQALVVMLYEQRVSRAEISRQTGTPLSSIRFILNRNGIAPHNTTRIAPELKLTYALLYHRDGVSTEEIARMHQVTSNAVSNQLRQFGFPVNRERRDRRSVASLQAVADMHADGRTLGQIASALGVSEYTVDSCYRLHVKMTEEGLADPTLPDHAS